MNIMRVRWIVLVIGIALLWVASEKGEMRNASIAFGIGAAGGFLLDAIGTKFRFWVYLRQPFLSSKYFLIVLPAWGVFGMAVNLAWDWWGVTPWLALTIITIGLFILHEIPNLKVKSWEYNVPLWFVFLSWVPLVGSFRILFLLFRGY